MDTAQRQQPITSMQRAQIATKLAQHQIQIQAILKLLRSDHVQVDLDQILSILNTLSETLDVILNPWRSIQ